jgi:hypothetical protein
MMNHYFAGRGLPVVAFVLLIVSLGSGVPAHANPIVYDLTGAGVAAGFSFQYTSQALISSPLTVPLASLDFCTPGAFFCTDVQFHPPSMDGVNNFYDIIQLCTAQCLDFYFPLGAFSAIGGYTDINNNGTLTVSAVPEPSTLLLLGTALLGLTAMTWRRAAA